MADSEQLSMLKNGVDIWNLWRAEHPTVSIDLTEANLKRMDLRGADLSKAYLGRVNLSESNLREANLSKATMNWADLRQADLQGANLHKVDLRQASVSGVNLSDADLNLAVLSGLDLSETNLIGAVLRGSMLVDADLREANLREVDLSGAILKRANLRYARLNAAVLNEADLSETNLNGADLRDTNLNGADLRSSRLQSARLDRAMMTGSKLWETQRSGWSIRGVECAFAFWDEANAEAVQYAPGEFERLYSSQARVELVYPGGVTTFEVNTLPALLHHLATLYPDSGIRLRSMEETGGGVRVVIHVDEADTLTVDKIRAEAKQAQAAQIALRDDQIARLQIQRELLLEDVLPRMMAAAGQHVQITGSATNLVIAGGRAKVQARQTFRESAALEAMLQDLMSRRGELGLANQDAVELQGAVHDVREELLQAEPNSSLIASGLKIVKEIVVKVVESTTEKALLEHWHPLLNDLTHFLSQMTQ